MRQGESEEERDALQFSAVVVVVAAAANVQFSANGNGSLIRTLIL